MGAYKAVDEVAYETATSEVQEGVYEGADGAVAARGLGYCSCSNAHFQVCIVRFRGQGYLEVEFDAENLLPQDLLSATVLREHSQSRDAELKVVD